MARTASPKDVSAVSLALGEEIGIASCSRYDANRTTGNLPQLNAFFTMAAQHQRKTASFESMFYSDAAESRQDGPSAPFVSIEAAIASGSTRFFTGQPCAKGHVAERRVRGRHCVECHRINAKNARNKGIALPVNGGWNGRLAPDLAVLADGFPPLGSVQLIFTVKSLNQALLDNDTRYFTGVPCIHGHIDQRMVSNGGCVACTHRQSSTESLRRRVLNDAIDAVMRATHPLPDRPWVRYVDAKAAGVKRYFEGKICLAGHIAPRYVGNHECTTCSRLKNSERYATDPVFRAKRIADETERNRRPAVRAKRLAAMGIYNRRPEVRARLLKRIRDDHMFKLKWGLRSYLCNKLRKTGNRKSARLTKILGCSVAAFAQHLERQFAVGMSWKNRSEWEIDHIVALSTATTATEVEALFHHTNMQPLWKRANRTKGSRRLNLI